MCIRDRGSSHADFDGHAVVQTTVEDVDSAGLTSVTDSTQSGQNLQDTKGRQ